MEMLCICANTDNIFSLLLSSSSLQGGTSLVQVPPSLSYYCRHQKPSGTVCLCEAAVCLSCLKRDLIGDDSHFSELNSVWYSQYLLSVSSAVTVYNNKDVRLASSPSVFMCDIWLESVSVLWDSFFKTCGQSIRCVTNDFKVDLKSCGVNPYKNSPLHA